MNTFPLAGGPPAVIAHRGASRVAPENTMAAFAAAWESGASWIEADVQPTSDGVPVMLHDDDLDRTTDGSGPVREQTAYNIAALDAGSWFSAEFAGIRVPELSEVLATLTPQRHLLLEIKGEHTAAQVLAEIDLCRASGFDEQVFLESFEVPALRHVRDIQPLRPVGLLVETIQDDPVELCRTLGALSYNPAARDVLAQPDVVARLHAAGIAVMVWTSDDPAEWERLTALGVDAIITNTPAELLGWQRRQAQA